MAVSFDVATQSSTSTNPGQSVASFNWSHTGSASAKFAVVHVLGDSATDHISNVTYGGVSMTPVPSGLALDAAGEPGFAKSYYLFIPPTTKTGTQTVVVSCTNNANDKWAVCQTFLGSATKVLAPGTTILVQGDAAYAEKTPTDGSPGSNSIRVACGYYGGNTPAPAGTNSTGDFTLDSGFYGYSVCHETVAGQGARSVGFTNATSDDQASVHFAVAELYTYTSLTSSDTGVTPSDSINAFKPSSEVG